MLQEKVRQGYTGYESDTESGLQFAQARYYNSATNVIGVDSGANGLTSAHGLAWAGLYSR